MTMRKQIEHGWLATLLLAGLLLFGGCSSDENGTDNDNGGDVSATNRVRIDCPVTIDSPGQDTTITVDFYITNDQNLGAFTLGFQYNSSQVEITDIISGTAIPPGTEAQVSPVPTLNQALVLWYDGSAQNPLTPKTDALAFSLVLSVLAGAPAQSINIDSTFVEPAGYWLFAFPEGKDARPALDNCGSADIIIR